MKTKILTSIILLVMVALTAVAQERNSNSRRVQKETTEVDTRSMTYDNGDIYVGQWRNGRRHGDGMLITPTADTCVCKWQNDLRQGLGVIKFANGDRVTAFWVDDYINGEVLLSYANGLVYNGEWDGECNGWGEMNYPNGATYYGTWSNGLRHGVGTFCYADKEHIYNGAWVDDVIMGEGAMVYRSEKMVILGTFQNGALIEASEVKPLKISKADDGGEIISW